jgi:hypothetical protein
MGKTPDSGGNSRRMSQEEYASVVRPISWATPDLMIGQFTKISENFKHDGQPRSIGQTMARVCGDDLAFEICDSPFAGTRNLQGSKNRLTIPKDSKNKVRTFFLSNLIFITNPKSRINKIYPSITV